MNVTTHVFNYQYVYIKMQILYDYSFVSDFNLILKPSTTLVPPCVHTWTLRVWINPAATTERGNQLSQASRWSIDKKWWRCGVVWTNNYGRCTQWLRMIRTICQDLGLRWEARGLLWLVAVPLVLGTQTTFSGKIFNSLPSWTVNDWWWYR